MKESTKHALKWVVFGLPKQLKPLTERERALGVVMSVLTLFIFALLIAFLLVFDMDKESFLRFSIVLVGGSYVGLILRFKLVARNKGKE